MTDRVPQSIAIPKGTRSVIACASGGFKVIFVHGVLSAFESANFRADAYSAASASVVVAALASIDKVRQAGVDYWRKGIEMYNRTRNMSQVSLAGINYFLTHGSEEFFRAPKSQFYVAASRVITETAIQQTQSQQARRLGKKLLIAAAKKERSWVDEHLKLDLFGTSLKENLALNRNNFIEVAYASTRMLHIYDIPAWINQQAYIDASYTCSCPVIEMFDLGYQSAIAISTEAGKFYRDLFHSEVIPTEYKQKPIQIIQPDIDLKELGVGVFQASDAGLSAVYQHGLEKGRNFLTQQHN